MGLDDLQRRQLCTLIKIAMNEWFTFNNNISICTHEHSWDVQGGTSGWHYNQTKVKVHNYIYDLYIYN